MGGDFYDVFELGDNKFGVLIGDVADKGVPSAIFMARAHALIIAEADNVSTPGEVLRMVNKHITRLEKSTQFVTALYGVLDTVTVNFLMPGLGMSLRFCWRQMVRFSDCRISQAWRWGSGKILRWMNIA